MRFALAHAPERADSLGRWLDMPVQEMRKSSAIERVAYKAEARELSIWFAGGRRYIYSDVPQWVYRELCAARSAGGFINAAIKGRYVCRCEPPRRRYFDGFVD